MTGVSAAFGSAGSLGAELTESQAAFRVFAAAGGLVLLGLVLLLLTIWWWRGTRPESPALGPLEVMGDRRWATAAESERRRLLEEFRPEGAVPTNLYVEPEPVDLSVLAREAPANFDDLREPSIDPEALELESEARADGLPAATDSEASRADDGDGVLLVEPTATSSGAAGESGEADEVDGTVAMAVPSLPSLPSMLEASEPAEASPPSELPAPHPPTDDPFGFAATPPATMDAPESSEERDERGGVDESEAMMSPDRHVSPNAGE